MAAASPTGRRVRCRTGRRGAFAPDLCRRESQVRSRALWIALAVNAVMFAAEVIAGIAAGSASLQADAVDFLGDAANYAVSLGVAGMGLAWRARAAFLKGVMRLVFGSPEPRPSMRGSALSRVPK
jgi:Co/Zn/Cd efflux system component